jgi:hypothetical protein
LKRILIIIGITILLVLVVFVAAKFDANHDVKLAKTYIKEYRFAKALSLLNDKGKRNNKELQQLLFYAAIKARNFKTAEIILDDIKIFDANFKKNFYEIVKILYRKGEDKLIEKVLARSNNIKLEQEYLIKISSKQKNIEKEVQVLLMGRKLFLDIKAELLEKKKIKDANEIKIDKLEKQLLEKYMSQANLFIAHQDFKSALEQMKQAETLTIFEKKDFEVDLTNGDSKVDLDRVEYKTEKASYKFLLGTINLYLGNVEVGKKLIEESAALGDLQAKDSLKQIAIPKG